MNPIVARLKSSEFFRNFLTLMTGTGIAALFPILCTPIITRLYSPEEFGLFALFLTFVSVLSTISCLRYEIAIVLPRYNYQAVQLVALSFILTCISAFILLLFFLIFAQDIATYLDKDIAGYLYVVPLAVFLNGLYGIMNYYSNRHKKYKDLSYSKVLNSGTSTLTKIGLGYTHFGAWGLVIGQVLGGVAGTFNIWRLSVQPLWKARNKLSWRALLSKFKDYKSYPLYNLPGTLLNVLSTNSAVFLFGVQYEAKDIGLIAMAANLIALPISIFTTSYSQIFYQKICILKRKADMVRAYNSAFILLLSVSTIFIISVFMIPESVIMYVLGDKWDGIDYYIRCTAIFFFFQFISAPLSMLIARCDKNDLFLIYQIFNLLLVSASIIVPTFYNMDIKSVFLIYVCVKSLMYFVYAILCRFVITFVK